MIIIQIVIIIIETVKGRINMKKITFMMLVFNGETIPPKGMMEATIMHHYDIAYEFLIVEGASKARASSLTLNGHSTDNTVEIIKTLQSKYKKIKLIQSPNGFWEDKLAMCKATNGIAKGDYICQLDVDEFYHEKDFVKILNIMENEPYAIYFYANHFWGNWNYCIDENSGKGWANATEWRRFHRNCPGKSKWIEHRPPAYLYKHRLICNKQNNIVTRDDTLKLGIKLYHYGFVKKSQINFKHIFYNSNSNENETNYKMFWKNWQKDHNSKLVYGDTTVNFNFYNHHSSVKKLIRKETSGDK